MERYVLSVVVASGNSQQKPCVRKNLRFFLKLQAKGKACMKRLLWNWHYKVPPKIAPNTCGSGCPVKALLGKKASQRLSSRVVCESSRTLLCLQ